MSLSSLIPACLALVATAAASAEVDFDRDVRPLLAKHCLRCHGAEKQRGGLRLDRRADARRGGKSGTPFVPGKPADSLLLQRVRADDADTRMPAGGEPLAAAEIAVLEAWIAQGAKWPDDGSVLAEAAPWWSLRPLTRPRLPELPSSGASAANPIDVFVLAKLQEQGLTPNPPADRRTLARRLSFDLIGLPPSPEEIEAFVGDPSPEAYEKLVDRLLASPHHGERWARHWLDVVRYADSHGYDKDQPRPHAWPYRDYVIRAFNSDKPFARFVQEQVAGDVLYPGTVDGIEALGFLAAGPWDLIGHVEVPESKIDGKVARHLDRDDFVSNTINTFVALTVHCAQCHDHKFDPITQEDYYRLQAVFAAIDRADRVYDADPDTAARRAQWEAALRDARRRIAELADQTSAEAKVELAGWEERARQAESELARLPERRQTVYIGTVHTGRGNFTGTGASGGKPRPIHVLWRGDVTRPGKEVGPGAIPSVPPGVAAFSLPPEHTEGQRRAALAAWLTDPDNPLPWRVMANRIWQYHFGRGLVDTPNDFGRMGSLPSHPELLDYLACELRQHQSLKRLHRLIVTSETYKRSSAHHQDNASRDADNRYLWRQNRRKLEAEAVRDALLCVAGKLDRSMGGPAFRDFVIERPEHSPHYQYHLHDPEDRSAYRRTVYRFAVRSKPQPFLAALDCADPSLAVDRRNETLTPQQALALWNNSLVLVMSRHFAARVEQEAASDADRVAVAFRLALGRSPTPAETDALARYAQQHGWANTCRIILNLSEFLFVD
jgi:cytochrome c553